MRRAIAIPLLLLTGCANRALPVGGDGGVDNDGSMPADLAGVSCEELTGSIGAWIDGHQACASDADCTILYTDCGLPGGCGVAVNNGAPGAYFSSLLDGWEQRCNQTPCAFDCAQLPPPTCWNGTCQTVWHSIPRLPIGSACTADAECGTGQCVTEAESGGALPGGLCTIRDCNYDKMDPCPAGTACRDAGNGHSYCLEECCATCKPNQNPCRDGWFCCGGPNGLCVPALNVICEG
jgi:hypothetical protein